MGLWLESDWVKIAPTDSTHQPPQAPRASDACGLCSQTPVWLSWPSFGQPAVQDLSASLFTCCLCALLSPYSIPEASSPGSPVSFGGHDSEGDPLVAFGVGFGWSLCLGCVASYCLQPSLSTGGLHSCSPGTGGENCFVLGHISLA